jgi:hypothetical protein
LLYSTANLTKTLKPINGAQSMLFNVFLPCSFFALLVCFLFPSRKSTRSSKKEANRQIGPPTVPVFMGVTGAINGVLFPFRIGVAASFSFPAPPDAPPNPPDGATHSTLR